jgi:hypothetical protein
MVDYCLCLHFNLSDSVTKRLQSSALPTQRWLAEAYGVTDRTIRNWRRKDPDDYHHQAGRWLGLAREWRVAAAFYPDGQFGRLFRASLVLHGICPGHITDAAKSQLYYKTKLSEFIHPTAVVAIRPENALQLAAAKLRLAGKDVTRQALAKELGVSLRTLYRAPNGAEKLRALCGISRHRKPMIESRSKPYNLAA